MPEPESFEPSPAYRWYVLAVLFVVYVVNFVDRQILSSVMGPIKSELGVSDFQMGLLGGTAFALLYAVAGIPIARWADVGVRRNVVALAVAVWSALTAACGTATSFAQLAAYRVGVGIGEAGGSAPSHSLIADYFPPERRARALAVLSMGLHVGIFIGLVIGSRFNEDWRNAFLIVGLPGIALALLVRLTVREPPRGASEIVAIADDVPGLRETFETLMRLQSVRWILVGASLAAFSGYSFALWGFEFFARSFELPRAEIGLKLGLITALGGGFGTWVGGQFADRMGRRDVRWYAWTCAIGLALSVPRGAATLYAAEAGYALGFGAAFLFAGALYIGPMYAILQAVSPPRMRSMAAAIMFFCNNLIGLGIGPPAAGLLSDVLAAQYGDTAMRHSLLAVTLVNLPVVAIFMTIARHSRREMAPQS